MICRIQSILTLAAVLKFMEIIPKQDYSGNSVGAYTYWNGLVMLGAGVPTTLGASTNYRNSGGAIIQDGKLI